MKRYTKFILVSMMATIIVGASHYWEKSVMASPTLPPVDDTPEEILRMEIITEARSPVDGKPLTAAEYAQLQTQLQTIPPPKLDPRLQEQIFLLQIRRLILQFFPFLDI